MATASIPMGSEPLLEVSKDHDHDVEHGGHYSGNGEESKSKSMCRTSPLDGINSGGSSSSSGSIDVNRSHDRRSNGGCLGGGSGGLGRGGGGSSMQRQTGSRSDLSAAEEAPGTETEMETETDTMTTTMATTTTTATAAARAAVAPVPARTRTTTARLTSQSSSFFLPPHRSRRGSGRARSYHRRSHEGRTHSQSQSRDYPRPARPTSSPTSSNTFSTVEGALSMLETFFAPAFGGDLLPLGLRSRQSTRNLDVSGCARVQRLLPQLHRTLLAAAFFGICAIVAAIALAARVGMALMASRDDQNCQGPMREWLRSYLLMWLIAPTLLPLAVLVRRASPSASRMAVHILWPSSVVSLLGWSAGGAAYLRPPSKCSPLHGLAAEALSLQLLHIMLLTIALMYIAAAQPLVRKVNDTLARSELVAQAAALSVEIPTADLPGSQECVICLGCVEDEEEEAMAGMNPDDLEAAVEQQHLEDPEHPCSSGNNGSNGANPPSGRPRWRQVQCGHRFHEDCLFEWLRKARVPSARRCPVCRHSLRRQVCRRHSHG
mmetsp:Transcript_62090/g.131158  ORF Transcript_62090/g.131158 Transcript_62090/m.131158 type:complete len:547 (-) Transcript_62090:75-1715(-)